MLAIAAKQQFFLAGVRGDLQRVAITKASGLQTLVVFKGDSLIADEPLSCVALGTGHCLEEMKTLKNVLTSMY